MSGRPGVLQACTRKHDAADDAAGIPLPPEREVALDSPLQPQSVATIVDAP
ncbi:MAG TPA: hypothetical protein VF738_02920 [Rhodanobacter sp.]